MIRSSEHNFKQISYIYKQIVSIKPTCKLNLQEKSYLQA